jgi:protein tyrosine kinase modulator
MGQELVPSIMDQRSLSVPAVEQGLDLRVYLDVLRRRWPYLVISSLTVFAAICAVTFLVLPSVYEATAKILVVSQMIPSDLAASTVAASATERIKVIEQRLTTRDNLLGIARKFDLYPNGSPSDIVDWIRKATLIEQIQLNNDEQAQRAQAVAFSLSFDYSDPVIAARVVNELAGSILEQNIQARFARAAETSKFFNEQATKLEGDLAELEKRIADFKKANEASSPDTLNDRRSRLAQQQSTIAEIDQATTLGIGPKDVVEAESDIKASNARLQSTQQQLQTTMEQRASLEGLFKKGYVTKIRLQDLDNRISQLQADIEQIKGSITVTKHKMGVKEGDPDFLPKKRAELAAQAAVLQQSIAKTPEVESGLNALLREYDNLKGDYRLAKSKTTVAATGEQMEQDRQAERFEVIEKADVPTKPIKPDRPRILLGGLFASLAAGAGMVILMEMLDKSIRSSSDLERLLQVRPLVAIPEIRRKSRTLRGWLLVLILLVAFALILVHELYLPLDVLVPRLLLPRYYGLT